MLSLVLTGDVERAEQCFVTGIEDVTNRDLVFGEWSHAWARRVVITNAIRLVQPLREGTAMELIHSVSVSRVEEVDHRTVNVSKVLRLPDLTRFVFVLTVIEGYRTSDCARLLECSEDTVHAAGLLARKSLHS